MVLQVRINPQDNPGGFSVFFFQFRKDFLRTYKHSEPRFEISDRITGSLINSATTSLYRIEEITELILKLLLAGWLKTGVIILPVGLGFRAVQHVRIWKFPTAHSQSKLSLDKKPGICSKSFGQLGRTLPVDILFFIRGISLLGPAPELHILLTNMPSG